MFSRANTGLCASKTLPTNLSTASSSFLFACVHGCDLCVCVLICVRVHVCVYRRRVNADASGWCWVSLCSLFTFYTEAGSLTKSGACQFSPSGQLTCSGHLLSWFPGFWDYRQAGVPSSIPVGSRNPNSALHACIATILPP